LEEVEFNEGIREGTFTWWHENGKKAMEGQFKNNKRTGKWISRDKQGKRFTQREYKDGEVVAEDKELNARSLANTKATYEIMTPRDYSPKKKYPLVLVLHGAYGSILHDKKFWKAEQLKELEEDYIFAFLQSSQVFDMNCFNWNNIETARKDIEQLYNKIIKKYPIDTNRVIIVGMSQGGQVAIDAAVNNIIPVSGFLACCPSKPENLNKEAVKQAVQRGVRGTILAGERDSALLPEAKEINELFKEMNLDHRFIVIHDMGHSVPPNSTEHFKAAVAHILGR
jgi:predicted esterase